MRFNGDCYDCKVSIESLKRVAATPSSCARCSLPAAPPNQTANEQVRSYARSRELQYSTSVCGRRLLRPLRVRQLLRVLSPCCVLRISCYSCLASDIRMCRHMDVKKYSAQIAWRCVPPRGAAHQHQPRGCAAHSSSVRTTRLLLRFELPGWYFGTTVPG